MTQLLVGILGGSGLFAVLAAVVTGMFSRRKLGADATQIITQAASGVVADIRQELDRKTIEMGTMRREHDEAIARLTREHDEEMDEVRTVLFLHVEWDKAATEQLAAVGVTLPPAPPLLPPRDHH